MCVVAPLKDFVPFEMVLLGAFNNSMHRHCFEVDIVDDKDIEDYEEFSVSLQREHSSNLYFPQTIESDSVTVRILDNDCKYQKFTNAHIHMYQKISKNKIYISCCL